MALPIKFLDELDSFGPTEIATKATGIQDPNLSNEKFLASLEAPETSVEPPQPTQAAPLPGISEVVPNPTTFTQDVKNVGRGIVDIATSPEVVVPGTLGVLGGIVGSLPGAMAGAGIGGGLVRAGRIAEERGTLSKETFKKPFTLTEEAIAASIPPGRLGVLASRYGRAVGEAIEGPEDILDISKAAALDAALEALGIGIAKGASKLKGSKAFAPFRSSVDPGVRELEENLIKHGGKASQSMVVSNVVTQKFDEIARAGYLSKGIMDGVDDINKIAMQRNRVDISKSFLRGLRESLDDEGIGILMRESDHLGRDAHKAITGALYDEVDRLAAGELQDVIVSKQVPSLLLDKEGKAIMKTVQETTKEYVGGAQVATKELKNFSKDFVSDAKAIQDIGVDSGLSRLLHRTIKLKDHLNFKSAQKLRSALSDEISKNLDNKPVMRMATKAKKLVDKSMEKAATDLSPEAEKAWRLADSFFKNGKEVFENDFMARLFMNDKLTATEVGRSIAKMNNPENVRTFKRALDYSEEVTKTLKASGGAEKIVEKSAMMDAVRFGYFESLVARNFKAADNVIGGNFNFNKFLAEFENRDRIAVIEELFEPAQIESIRKFIKTGILAEKKAGGGGLGLVQAGAVVGGFTGMFIDPIAAAGGLTAALGVPVFIAKLITSKNATKMMTKGFEELSKGTQRSLEGAIGAFSRAGIELHRDEMKRNKNDALNPSVTLTPEQIKALNKLRGQ